MTDGGSANTSGDRGLGPDRLDALVQESARVQSVQELAQLLRALRRRHARRRRDSELSYRELAAQTGWSHAAIAEYLTGRTLPPTDRLDGLLRVLGASAAELGAVATARDRVDELRRSEHAAEPASGDKARDKAGGGAPMVPRQLPAVPPHFVGRAAELAALSELAARPLEAGTVVIFAVAGMAGIGKTALAVHAGHRLAQRFPDGQLFVDLRGFTAGMSPVQPAQALDRLLRDVGVPGERIPSEVDERAALWRSMLAGRRMLVVLDNAATEAQVQPLLPGAAGCLVLVTSRRRLTGLETTHAVSLDTLPQADAVDLFVRAADRPELAAQTRQVRQVVQLCGRLPLAVRIAAARLKHRRVWTVQDLLVRLQAITGLEALDDGQRSVHTTLHLSYQHLSAPAQRLYRLLGLHPGPDVDPYATAALTAGPPDEARQLLDRLVNDHILEESSPGRFQFHDLVRAHAAGIAVGEETPAQRRAAVTRLLDHYRHTAAMAMAVAHPHERQRRPTVPPAPTPGPDLGERKRAESWLDAELPNLLAAALLAAQHGWPEHLWHLSATLGQHLQTRGRYREMQTLHQHALDLARKLGNHRAEIDAHHGLGIVQRMLGHHDKAGDHLEQALRIAQEIGDRVGERIAHDGLGHVCIMLGHHERSCDHYEMALQIASGIGDRSGERQALTGLGHVCIMMGRYEEAGDHHGRALQIARDLGDRAGERQALTGLGMVHRMTGSYEQASVHYRQALQIAQDLRDTLGELQTLNALGTLHRMLGHHGEAARHYQQTLDRARDLDNSNWQFEALQGLGRLRHLTGQHELALTHHQQALQLATNLAQPTDQSRAHDGLAHAYRALDEHDQARHHWQCALDILARLGTEHTEETNVASIRANLAEIDARRRARA
ncbi:SARP family transcriptional regulator [Rhizocola hellebori]|uniref:SARP family transcriptional regulator n=1 Tax=Rhizocola hellebori TaxID=1392758 RepID=A0A8J3Q229_9ACTN|nr:helix-turn-helix domain-containing protein [Rhizocola hellebori]GIH02206.1 SARP family transcriptional regulator [Rhizocola hellebori]